MIFDEDLMLNTFFLISSSKVVTGDALSKEQELEELLKRCRDLKLEVSWQFICTNYLHFFFKVWGESIASNNFAMLFISLWHFVLRY